MFTKVNDKYIMVIGKDEPIIKTLIDFCEKENIKNAVFNGIGVVKEAKIGFFSTSDKKYEFKEFNEPMEITCLTGNVTIFGDKPLIHCHITLSDRNFDVYGGHLEEAVVGVTCEIVLHKLDSDIKRKNNNEFNLKLIDL